MKFDVFWEALGDLRVTQNASKNDANNHREKSVGSPPKDTVDGGTIAAPTLKEHRREHKGF